MEGEVFFRWTHPVLRFALERGYPRPAAATGG